MKVKNVTVWNTFNASQKETSPYRKLMSPKWPGEISYQLVKLGKILSNQASLIEEARQTLIKQFTEAKKDFIKDDSPDFGAFISEFKTILEQEEELDIKPVKIPAGKIPDIEPETLMWFMDWLEIEEAVK